VSRPSDREVGEGISVVGGTPAGRFATPRAPGTTVEVEDLFFNTPARRKFLKSPAAEQVEVAQTLERIYLARPHVTLRFESEGREIATYPATSDLTDAASRVLGSEFLHSSFLAAGTIPGGRLYAALGRPPLAATSMRGLYVAVNGRAISSRPISQAVRVAFGDYLPRTRYPVGAVHLEVGLDRLDVNVHPTKREVRFAREREVAEAIRLRVREALIGTPQVADLAAGATAPRVTPDLQGPKAAVTSPPEAVAVGNVIGPAAPRQQRLEGVFPAAGPTIVGATPGHPRLELLGCLQALYWVAESDDGMVLIDQHAASERVVYESLRHERPVARQTLVEPVPLRLTGAERSAWIANAPAVAQAGFEVEEFGPETVLVRSVPSFAGHRVRLEALTELLDELAAGGRPTLPDGLTERTAATLACHAAIRAGDVVSAEEFSRVLAVLHALPESAYSCPHGRPIVLRIPRSRLDRWFLRSGP
jgi:DNA mismatch repair protein MutL